MINKIYIFFLTLLINVIDNKTKRQITKFFKEKFKDNKLNIIDVGAHKGETVHQFLYNFNIKNIFAIEANPSTFKILKEKKFKEKNKIFFFNIWLGKKNEEKYLNIFNESSSSTFMEINENSSYFLRKKKILGFFTKDVIVRKNKVKIITLSDFIKENNINKIDILKIDTEGSEFNILQGLDDNNFKMINYIFFEHHYDLMLKKNYNFSDINLLLIKNNFRLCFKNKMRFRKTFEYIYEKK